MPSARVLQLFVDLCNGKTRTINIGNILMFAGRHTDENYYLIITDRQTRNQLPMYKSNIVTHIANKMTALEDMPIVDSYWAPSRIKIEDLISIEELRKLI